MRSFFLKAASLLLLLLASSYLALEVAGRRAEATLELIQHVWSLRGGLTDLGDPDWLVETSSERVSIERIGGVPEVNEMAVHIEFSWPTTHRDR